MPVYNKLVRDLIPKIIKKDNKQCTTKILSEDEYIKELRKKIFEELDEYIDAKNDEDAIEELADILEIIHALAKYHGSSIETVEVERKHKKATRGGFEEKIYLIEVLDE